MKNLFWREPKKWKGAKIDFGMPPREGEGIGNQSSFQSCNSIKARTFFTEELEFNFRAKKKSEKENFLSTVFLIICEAFQKTW